MAKAHQPRILHLIDARSGAGRASVFAQMASVMGALDGYSHQTLILGPGRLAAEAEQAGLGPPRLNRVQTLGTPFGRLLPAIPAVSRRLRMVEPVDMFHCWSVRSAMLVQLLRPGTPRVVHFNSAANLDDLSMIKRLLAGDRKPTTKPTRVVTLTAQIARVLGQAGVGEDEVSVVGPMISIEGPGRAGRAMKDGPNIDQTTAREQIRGRWGISQTDTPPTLVVALLGDPAYVGDTVEGLMSLGLVQRCLEDAPHADLATTPRLRLLVHPSQHRRALGVEQAQANQWYDAMIQDDALARPWQVMPGCDLALDVGGDTDLSLAGANPMHGGFDVNGHRLEPTLDTAGLSTAWALAFGLPVVSPRHGLCQSLTHESQALIPAGPAPRALSPWILQLVRHPEQRTRISQAAAAHAQSTYLTERALPTLQALYSKQLSTPVDP